MSMFKKGGFAYNPNVDIVLANPTYGNGYSTIDEAFEAKQDKINLLLNDINKSQAEFNKPITITSSEVDELLTKVYEIADSKEAEDSVLKPVFFSVIDGAMRAFKVPTNKLGLTPSRIFMECEAFDYTGRKDISYGTDSLTEYALEQEEYRQRTAESTLKTADVRDQNKMNKYKEKYFNGETTAQDEYSPDEIIYVNNKEAFASDGMNSEGKEKHPDSAETDHIIPCKVLCERLKGNKALTAKDIKNIVNSEDNLAVTSRDINNAKSSSTNTEFVETHQNDLTEAEKQALLAKEKKAQKSVDSQQNKTVIKNLCNDREIQKTFAKDAGKAAALQIGGDILLNIFKPIYFEMKDSIKNGIEAGVSQNDFKKAITIRFKRAKDYILNSSLKQLATHVFDFFKSFISVLVEAIIGCLAGIFKMIWRLLKEGFKIMMGAVKILQDKNKSFAEKGDAILKLAAVSISAVAGIYINGALENLAIPEPWSMLLASILSAVVASGILYLLNRLDVFNTRKDARHKRVLEILDEMNQQIAVEAESNVDNTPYVYVAVCY